MNDISSTRKAVAQRLRISREHAGLSQGQVAKLLNIHRPTISEIEAGRRKVSVEEILKFSEIYGVAVGWLSCEKTTEPDITRDKIELAARQLVSLKESDLESIIEMLSALKKNEGTQ